MNTGYISIGERSVFILPYDGEVWLTAYEIAELFGVFTGAVTANIKSIFKNGILDERQAYKAYSNSKGVIDFYNLRMIIALSYRLTSRKAEKFREWIHDNLSLPIIPTMSINPGLPN